LSLISVNSHFRKNYTEGDGKCRQLLTCSFFISQFFCSICILVYPVYLCIPERLRGVFTARCYTNPRLPLPCSHDWLVRPNAIVTIWVHMLLMIVLWYFILSYTTVLPLLLRLLLLQFY